MPAIAGAGVGVEAAGVGSLIDAMTDLQVREVYKAAELAGSMRAAPELRETLKGEDPQEIAALIDRLKIQPGVSAIDAALAGFAPLSKADKLRKDADRLMADASSMLDGIQPGQPVLSTRDRNLRDKSMEKARKAADLSRQADELDKATNPPIQDQTGGTPDVGAGVSQPMPVAAPTGGKTQGQIGMKFGSGEVVLTASGRETTPFPKVALDTNRKATNTVRSVDRWLMQNALDEARARGDNFNARQFEANLERPQQADKDSAEEYLFGQQPEVLRPLLRPLNAKPADRSGYKQGDGCWCDYNAEHPEDADVHCQRCHTFITDGKVQFLSDCTHALAGQTLDLPELPPHLQDNTT